MGNQDVMFTQVYNDLNLLSKIVFKQFFLAKVILDKTEKDDSLFDDFINNEAIVDSIEAKIKNEIITSIVLYNPRATNLRKMISFFEITGFLERIGDHLLNIVEADNAINKNETTYLNCCPLIKKMFGKAESMVQNATFALICNDYNLAYKTISDDDEVDNLEINIDSLISSPFETIDFKDKADFINIANQTANNTRHINTMAINIERIADNATNISESAVYIIEGKDIKHKNQNNDD